MDVIELARVILLDPLPQPTSILTQLLVTPAIIMSYEVHYETMSP